jgi:hypothetical protein
LLGLLAGGLLLLAPWRLLLLSPLGLLLLLLGL